MALTVYPHDVQPGDLPGLLLTHGLGRITDAIEATLIRRINGDHALTIRVPLESQSAALLRNDRLIGYGGQLYRILRIKPEDKLTGRVLKVEAPHVIYDLRDSAIVNIETKEDDRYPDGIDARTALTQILAGTPFAVGVVDVDAAVLDYLDVLQLDRMTVIKEQLLKLWGGELVPDNWTVHLRAQMGVDRRYPIRHKRNIKEITCTEDIEPVVTRLHVKGYESANIEDINGGKDYLDSQYIEDYSHIREGYETFDDVDDPQELMRLGLSKLAERELPDITWECQLADMRRQDYYRYYEGLERFELGDTACLHHPYFAADMILRCTELTHDAIRGINTNVVLGNAKADLLGAMSGLRSTTEAVRKVVTTQGYLKAERIAGALDFARVTNLQAEIIRAATAYLETAQISWATIQGLTAGTLLFQAAEGERLYCAKLLVTDANVESLSANKVIGGVAAFGALMVTGEDGRMYRVTITAAGEVVAVQRDMESDDLGNYIITERHMADGTLTARTLNVAEIFASSALIGQITSQHIQSGSIRATHLDVDEILGNAATFGKITARHLSSEVGGGIDISANSYIQMVLSTVQETAGALTDYQSYQSTYMRYTLQDGLELGKVDDPYKVRLSHERLAFLRDGAVIAYISGNYLYITDVHILRSIKLGVDGGTCTYAWTVSSDHLKLTGRVLS